MRSLPVLFLAVFVLPAQEQPVAFVRGRSIMAADLDPDPRVVQQHKTSYLPAQFEQWLAYARQQKISSLIWAAVKEEFCRNRECEPNEAELTAFDNAFANREMERRVEDAARLASMDRQIAALPAGSPKRLELEKQRDTLRTADEALRSAPAGSSRNLSMMWVGNWKFFRELYRAYGGKVIFQQAGPEPLEAMRKLLEEHHKLKLFGIYDPELNKQFWAYYTSMRHNDMPDGGKFLETPWWLQSKPVKR
jgi:hypothetical protein